MGYEMPMGYWLKGERDGYLCIGFEFAGHCGGECEIFLPEYKIRKFCSNEEWRAGTVSRFRRIVFLAAPELNVPIPLEERSKSGIVPDDWE
jgi:hypothetical protein